MNADPSQPPSQEPLAGDAQEKGYHLAEPAALSLPVQPGTPHVALICSACKLRLEFPIDLVGQEIVCPDCGRKQVVPPPPPPEPPPRDVMAGYDPTEIRLGAVPERAPLSILHASVSTSESMAEPLALRVEPQAKPGGPRVVQYEMPFVRGVFNFPSYPTQLVRMIVLTCWLTLERFLISATAEAMSEAQPGAGLGGLVEWGTAALLMMTTGMTGFFFVAFSCAYILRIVVETAAGVERNVSWGGFSWLDWFWDGVFVVTAAVLSTVPGWILRGLLYGLGLDGVWCIYLSMYVFFPLLLLSMLEADSAAAPFSLPIWGSLKPCQEAWFEVYALSAILWTMISLSVWLLGLFLSSWSWPFTSLLQVVAMMIYCRLLGRITWFIPETRLSEEEDAHDEAVPEQSSGLMTGD